MYGNQKFGRSSGVRELFGVQNTSIKIKVRKIRRAFRVGGRSVRVVKRRSFFGNEVVDPWSKDSSEESSEKIRLVTRGVKRVLEVF